MKSFGFYVRGWVLCRFCSEFIKFFWLSFIIFLVVVLLFGKGSSWFVSFFLFFIVFICSFLYIKDGRSGFSRFSIRGY